MVSIVFMGKWIYPISKTELEIWSILESSVFAKKIKRKDVKRKRGMREDIPMPSFQNFSSHTHKLEDIWRIQKHMVRLLRRTKKMLYDSPTTRNWTRSEWIKAPRQKTVPLTRKPEPQLSQAREKWGVRSSADGTVSRRCSQSKN